MHERTVESTRTHVHVRSGWEKTGKSKWMIAHAKTNSECSQGKRELPRSDFFG